MDSKRVSCSIRWLVRLVWISQLTVFLPNIFSLEKENLGYWEGVYTSSPDFPISSIKYVKDRYFALGSQATIASSYDGKQWTVHNSRGSLNESMEDISYGNGVFVATGLFGTVFTSADGCDWQRQFSGVGRPLSSILFENGEFIAAGNFAIITSEDGSTWSVQIREEWLSGIAYGNGKYVAVGTHGDILTSSDKKNWSSQTFPEANFWDVAYGNGKFVAIALERHEDNGFRFEKASYTSKDGILWKRHPQEFGILNFYDIHFDGNNFIAVGDSGFYAISKDGENWKFVEEFVPSFLSVTNGPNGYIVSTFNGPILQFENPYAPSIGTIEELGEIDNLQRSGGRVFATAVTAGETSPADQRSYVLSTSNGKDWNIELIVDENVAINGFASSEQDSIAASADGKIYKLSESEGWIEKHNDKNIVWEQAVYGDDEFLAFGANRNDTSQKVLYRSSDGNNWVKVSSYSKDFKISDIVYYNDTYIGAGKNMSTGDMLIATSTNGTVWADRISDYDTRGELTTIVFGNGVLLAGNDEVVLRSEDGLEWVEVDLAESKGSGDLAFANEVFVRIFDDGEWQISSDGETWTKHKSLNHMSFNALETLEGHFIAAGNSPGNFAHSEDGETWTQRESRTNSVILEVVKGNGIYLAATEEGSVLLSVDSESWITIEIAEFGQIRGLAYGNGKFVLYGDPSSNPSYRKFATSIDGRNWTFSNDLSGVPYNRLKFLNGEFISYGSSSYATSKDGLNWNILEDFEYIFYDIEYAQGIYIAGGLVRDETFYGSPAIFSSNNGSEWQFRYSSGSGNFSGYEMLAYGNGRFVAVEGKSDAVYSTDGIDWISVNPGVVGIFDGLAFGGGFFVSGSTEGQAFATQDGETWEKISTNTSTRVRGISYFDDAFWIYGHAGNIERLVSQEKLEAPIVDTSLAFGVPINAKFVFLDPDRQIISQDITSTASISTLGPATNGLSAIDPWLECAKTDDRILYSPDSGLSIGSFDTFEFTMQGITGTQSDNVAVNVTLLRPLHTRHKQNVGLIEGIDLVHLEIPISDGNRFESIVRQPTIGSVELLDNAIQYSLPETLDDDFEETIIVQLQNPEVSDLTNSSFQTVVFNLSKPSSLEARNDIQPIRTDSLSNLDVLINDRWSANISIPSMEIIESPANGTANVTKDPNADYSNGWIQYIPNGGFQGLDKLSYLIRDENGELATAEVKILVADTITYEDWRLSVFGNSTDPAGEPLAVFPDLGISNLQRYALGQEDSFESKGPVIAVNDEGEAVLSVDLAQDPLVSYELEIYEEGSGWRLFEESEASLEILELDPVFKPQLLVPTQFRVKLENVNTVNRASLMRLKVKYDGISAN